jgi:glycerol-3-phosphate acyltransferase PlsY
VNFALVVAAGYLAGSCPWGYWLPRLFRGEDVRRQGSGSIGASNVWRSYGRTLGLPVVVLDALKGYLPALAGVLLVSHLGGIVAGVAAMLGHARPLFLRFEKGGKMVATGGGVLFAVCGWVALAVGGIWVATFLASRYTSLASIVSAVALPVLALVFGSPTEVVAFAAFTGAAVIVLHRGNLRRLRAGTENRFKLRRAARV